MKLERGEGDEFGQTEGERGEGGKLIFFIFLLFASFSDLRKLERRFSSELKAKLIYATRATRGHKKLEFRQTP